MIIILLSMSYQSDNDKDVIKGFINTYFVVKQENLKISDLQNYILYDKLSYDKFSADDKKNLNKYFNFMIDLGYKELKKNNFKYKIYSSQEINPKIISHYKVLYSNQKRVYYVVSGQKIFSFFIIGENNKIISFFSRDFISQGESVEPFIFTSKSHLEALFKN